MLADVELAMPASTALYGEGFQMLTQTGGALEQPQDYSQYTDARHYRIAEPAGARVFYGLLTLTPPGKEISILGFTSCSRFSGKFIVAGSLPVLRRIHFVLYLCPLAWPPSLWPSREALRRATRARRAC